MEPPTLRKAGSKQEEGFGVQPSSMADLGMVPSLRRSNSSLSKTRRLHHLFSYSAKVGFWGLAGPPRAGPPEPCGAP